MSVGPDGFLVFFAEILQKIAERGLIYLAIERGEGEPESFAEHGGDRKESESQVVIALDSGNVACAFEKMRNDPAVGEFQGDLGAFPVEGAASSIRPHSKAFPARLQLFRPTR